MSSIRRRLAIAGVVTGIVISVGAVSVGVATDVLITNVDRNVTRYSPALVQSANLLLSLVNQESGVRGYIATGDKSFLQPYEEGVRAQTDALTKLRQLVGDDPTVVAAVRDVVDAVSDWHGNTAVARIAEVESGKTVSLDEADADRDRFDRVRSTQAMLNQRLERLLSSGYHKRLEAQRALIRLMIILGVGVIVGMGLIAYGTSRWVVRPLLFLRDEARQVVSGNFEHVIAIEGPREIRDLTSDVEEMRQRITDELVRVDSLRAEADEKAVALEQSNADLEQFAYVASHDLQEPLRKVSNFCQLLERQYGPELDDRARQYIAYSVDGARRMQALIQDLLAFSRVGRTTEGFVPVNLADVARDAANTIAPDSDSDDATITVDPELPTVMGDASLLETLFQNLIGNAVKYRGDAPPVVEVKYDGVRDDEHLISVTDNGIGIDPKYADRIFVIFQRLHLRDEYSGTGIGLAISRKIVDYHHGKIWLDQEPSAGARFWVSFPVIGASDD